MHGFQTNVAQLLLQGGEVPFETFFKQVEGQGHRGQIKVKMVINRAFPGHTLYIYAWISKQFCTFVVFEKEKCHSKHVFT